MKHTERNQAIMRRIGLQLIAEKKAAILAEKNSNGQNGVGLERKDVRGRDLLTLLIKANMATDIPENQRLTDEEVLARESRMFSFSYGRKLIRIYRGTDVRWMICSVFYIRVLNFLF